MTYNIQIVLMVESRISGAVYHSILCHDKANGKYLNFNYNKNKCLSQTTYFGKNNLFGSVRSMKLPVDRFEWDERSKFIEKCFKKYENSDIGYFLKQTYNNLNCQGGCTYFTRENDRQA